MWPPLLAAVVVVGLLAAPDAKPGDLVRNAANEKELDDAIVRIEASGVDLAADLRFVGTICERWEALERPERARELLEGLRGRVGERGEPRRLHLLAQHLRRTGDIDGAVAAARASLDALPATPEDPLARLEQKALESDVLLTLGQALEEQGDLRGAITVYERWFEPPSFCGWDGGGSSSAELGIVRCRAALGEVDAALSGLIGRLRERRYRDAAGARLVCVLAARHDCMALVHEGLDAEDDGNAARTWFRPYLRFGDALASKDAAALRGIVETPPDSECARIAAEAYAELDDDAVEDLCKRIVRGDRVALNVASLGRIRAARRAILSRAALDGADRDRLEAIARGLE